MVSVTQDKALGAASSPLSALDTLDADALGSPGYPSHGAWDAAYHRTTVTVNLVMLGDWS